MGTAIGLLGTVESAALTCFPLIASKIVDSAKDIETGCSKSAYFYMGISKCQHIKQLGTLGLLFSISLYYVDVRGSIILDFVNPLDPT